MTPQRAGGPRRREVELQRQAAPAFEPLFRARTLRAVIALCALSLLLAFWAGMHGPVDNPFETPLRGPRSRSAVGTRAFADLLRKLGYQVRTGAGLDPFGNQLTVVLEPAISSADPLQDPRAIELKQLWLSRSVLVVLPKWSVEADPLDATRVGKASLLSAERAALPLAALGASVTVTQGAKASPSWSSSIVSQAAPDLVSPQLFESGDLKPLLAQGGKQLAGLAEPKGALGFLRGPHAVLADPDLISNAGLHRSHNALLAAALVARLCPAHGTIALVDRLDPEARGSSVFGALLRFPLSLCLASAVLCTLLAFWMALGRFGPPEPSNAPIRPGQSALVESTAELLVSAKGAPRAVRIYLQAAVEQVAAQLHAPRGLAPARLRLWLASLEEARRLEPSGRLARLDAELAAAAEGTPRRAVAFARLVHRWKQELLHGSQ